MKRIVSMVLMVLLLAGFATPVLAAEPAPSAPAESGLQEIVQTAGEGGYSTDFYAAQKLAFPQKKVVITAGKTVKVSAMTRDEDGDLPYSIWYSHKDYYGSKARIKTTLNKKTAVMSIRGLRPGTLKMTASAGGKKVTLTIQVVARGVNRKVKAIKGTVPRNMNVGETRKIAGKYTPANATNAVVTYKSSNASVAVISPTGYLTAFRPGNANITISAGGKRKIFKLTVNEQAATAPAGNLPTTGWTTVSGTAYSQNFPVVGEFVVMFNENAGASASTTHTSVGVIDTAGKTVYSAFVDSRTAHAYVVVEPGQQLNISRYAKFIPAEQCPRFGPDTAGLYRDGYFRVGRDLPAGVYNAAIAAGQEGSLRVYNKAPFTYDNLDAINETLLYLKNGQYVYLEEGAYITKQ